MTSTGRQKNRLAIIFATLITGTLLMVPGFSFAADETGDADPSPTRSGDAKATGHLISNRGEATHENPAEGRIQDERAWGVGYYEIPLTLEFDYEHVPEESYRLDVKAYNLANGDKIKDYNMLITISPGSGSDNIDCSVMGPLMPGDYRFEAKLYVEGNPEKDIRIEPEGEMSLILRVKGVTESKILVDGDTLTDRTLYNILTMDRVEAGCQITHSLKLEDIEPNQQYDLTAEFVKIDFSSGWRNIEKLKGFNNTAVSDEEGNLTFLTDMDVNDLLKTGEVYSVRYIVTNANDRNDSHRFWPFQSNEGFVRRFSLDSSYLLTINKPKEPEVRKTQVDVDISNYIKGTGNILKGAKLKLVRGSGPDGEEIDSWTVGDNPHSVRLEVGDYTVVQTSVPSGYKLAEPVRFTVKDRTGSVRGGNFIAYSINYDWTTDSADGFYIKEDISHQGSRAFCVNYGLNNPQPIDMNTSSLLYFKEIKLEDDDSFARLTNPRYGKEKTIEALKGVVYAGYPDDGAGLKDKYSLSGNEFEKVTQAAVHYYTDTIQYTLGPGSDLFNFGGEQRLFDAYNELIAGNLKYPEGMTVRLYIPEAEGYQSLIATRFEEVGTGMEVAIVNEKIPDVKDESRDDTDNDDSGKNENDKHSDKRAEDKGNSSHSVHTGDNARLLTLMTFLIIGMTLFTGGFTIRRRSR